MLTSGLNARARMTLDVLGKAVQHSSRIKAEGLGALGDLFDTSKPLPQLIKAFQDALYDDLFTFAVRGNHDMESEQNGDHALGPLTMTGNVLVLEQPGWFPMPRYGQREVQVGVVPFRTGPAAEWFLNAVAAAFPEKPQPGIKRVLCFHLGISDADTAVFLQGADDSVPVQLVEQACRQHGVTAAFAGNWHNRKRWDLDGLTILQVGSLCPTGFDNPGVDGYGTLAVWDSEAPNPKAAVSHLVLPGPRFITVLSPKDFAPQAKKAAAQGCTLFARLKVPADLWADAVEITTSWMDAGLCEFAEAVLDDEDAKQAAREAVQAARGSETLEQAFATYVGEMQLPEGVEPGAVLTEVQGCMRAVEAQG